MTYPTGLPQVDQMIGGGLRPGHLVLVAGASQSGMTTMLDTIIRATGFTHSVPTMLVDCETSPSDRVKRLLSAVSGVDLAKLQGHGPLTAEERTWVHSVADASAGSPVVHLETMSVGDIDAALRRADPRVKVLVVDGGRFLDYDYDAHAESHDAQMAVALRGLATRHDVAVVMTQPMTHPDRYDGTPALAHLPEGLAFTADHVVLLHRPDLLDERVRPGEVDLIVAKSRGGTTGTVTVRAEVHKARFMPDVWPKAA